MRTRTILLILLLCSVVAADNLEKTQKKELEEFKSIPIQPSNLAFVPETK